MEESSRAIERGTIDERLAGTRRSTKQRTDEPTVAPAPDERKCICGCGRSLAGKRRHAKVYADACKSKVKRRRRDPLVGSRERRYRRRDGLDVRFAAKTRSQAHQDLRRAGLLSDDPAAWTSAPEGSSQEVFEESCGDGALFLEKRSGDWIYTGSPWDRVTGRPRGRYWIHADDPNAGDGALSWVREYAMDSGGSDSFAPGELYIGFKNGANPEPGWHSGPYWPREQETGYRLARPTFDHHLRKTGLSRDELRRALDVLAEDRIGAVTQMMVANGLDQIAKERSVRSADLNRVIPLRPLSEMTGEPRGVYVKVGRSARWDVKLREQKFGKVPETFSCRHCGTMVTLKKQKGIAPLLDHWCKPAELAKEDPHAQTEADYGEKKGRNIYRGEEVEMSTTAAEQILGRVDLMESRVAEVLLRVQESVDALAERFADSDEVQTLAERYRERAARYFGEGGDDLTA